LLYIICYINRFDNGTYQSEENQGLQLPSR